MKKPNIAAPAKPTHNAKTGQPVATVATEAKPKKPDSTRKPSNKPKGITLKPASAAKAGQPAAMVAAEGKPKKASPPTEIL